MQDPYPVGRRGIVPSLNTPFTADDAVDIDSVRPAVSEGGLFFACIRRQMTCNLP
jgi:hypothetical protein